MASSSNLGSSMPGRDSDTFNSIMAAFRLLLTPAGQLAREKYLRMMRIGNSLERPRTRAAVQSPSESAVKNEKNQFQVVLNVSHFKPNEIEIKVVDNYIVIHGKHEEIIDEHGFIQREFTRRYMLPEGSEADTVKSSLNADGILTIAAPKKDIEAPASNERVVPISLSSMM